MPRNTKKAWTAPTLQDFNVSSRKRYKPDGDVVDSAVLEPKSVSELAVHPKKVAEVRKWIKECFSQKAPIALLSGPPGSGKTVTLKLVAEAEGLSIMEWISPISKSISGNFLEDGINEKNGGFYDMSENKKFEEFVNKSSRYPSLFQPKKRTLVLVKDFPNVFIWRPDLFHTFLEKYVICGRAPIAFILTDDENLDFYDNLFPNNIKTRLHITAIKFNPVSDTYLKKNLKNLTEKIKGECVPAERLDKIAKNAVGDLRSATMEIMVQLRTGELNFDTAKRRKHDSTNLEKIESDVGFMYSRDRGYEFFKKMGRVLYPKRSAEESNTMGTTFVHNILEIAENWTKTNLSFLHENYITTYSKLEDAMVAADCFSFCDILARHWEMEALSGVIAVAGLMTSNTQPKKNGFLPFKKSVHLGSGTEWKCTFSEACALRFGAEEKVFALDIAPMKEWLFLLDVDPCIRTLKKGNIQSVPYQKSIKIPIKQNLEKEKEEIGDDSETSSEEFEIEEVED